MALVLVLLTVAVVSAHAEPVGSDQAVRLEYTRPQLEVTEGVESQTVPGDLSVPNTINNTLDEYEMSISQGSTTPVIGNELGSITSEDKEKEAYTDFCSSGSCFSWKEYYRLADIYGYINYLQKKYPNIVRVETIGFTAEERPIKLVKILTSTNNTKTDAIWIDGGIHAREWITPAAAMFIIHEVLSSLEDTNSSFSGLEYYIVPVMNPDGYEYSHTTNRNWRKNRSLNNGSSCIGTDLNRNWGFKWGGKESFSDPCSFNYRGLFAFSEAETASVYKYMLKKRPQIKAYLTLHSYGQAILFPWAYTFAHIPDFKDIYDLSYYMALKVRAVGGKNYQFGPASRTFYIASGGSQDWAKAEAGIKYSYTMELRDNGTFRFALPVSEILETSKEAFAAFTVLAQKVKTGKSTE